MKDGLIALVSIVLTGLAVIANFFVRFFTDFKNMIKLIVKMENPILLWAPIVIGINAALTTTVLSDSIYRPFISYGVTPIVIIFQWRSLVNMIRKKRAERTLEEKERFQLFLEDHSPIHGLVGSIRFLSIHKESWYAKLYYEIKGITRLTLYRYGNSDHLGSHTKFSITGKQLFHLNLKGYIDTEDPHLAVDAISYIGEQQKIDNTA